MWHESDHRPGGVAEAGDVIRPSRWGWPGTILPPPGPRLRGRSPTGIGRRPFPPPRGPRRRRDPAQPPGPRRGPPGSGSSCPPASSAIRTGYPDSTRKVTHRHSKRPRALSVRVTRRRFLRSLRPSEQAGLEEGLESVAYSEHGPAQPHGVGEFLVQPGPQFEGQADSGAQRVAVGEPSREAAGRRSRTSRLLRSGGRAWTRCEDRLRPVQQPRRLRCPGWYPAREGSGSVG